MQRIPHSADMWRKSSYSGKETNCVEVALGREVGVRDSKRPGAGQLTVSASDWSALIGAVKSGRLG